ncbi:ankyrin repeat-containing protein [Tanacetum coccineum]
MLHVAVSSEHPVFMQKLVNIMQTEDLKLQNRIGNTALGLAAITGNTQIASILLNGNRGLLTMENKKEMIPLYIAVLYGKRDMVNYLYNETNGHEWTEQNKKWVYVKCVEADLFGEKFICIPVSPHIPMDKFPPSI